jgi:hypothetical protein
VDEIERFLEHAVIRSPPSGPGADRAAAGARNRPSWREYPAQLESARPLGRRTAELHLAGVEHRHPDFKPEPFTTLVQRAMYPPMRQPKSRVFQLAQRPKALPDPLAESARRGLAPAAR